MRLSFCVVVCFVFVVESCYGFESYQDYVRDKVLRVMHALTPSSPKRVINKRDVDDETEDSTDETSDPIKEEVDKRSSVELTFKDCYTLDDAMIVEKMIIEPKPLLFMPGPLDLSYIIHVKDNFSAPLTVKLEMSKKINLLFGLSTWLDIPCIPTPLNISFGSCSYGDICDIPIFRDGICVGGENGIEDERCGCPIVKGEHTSKVVRFDLPAIPDTLPKYVLEGDFFLRASIWKGDQQLLCFSSNAYLDL